MPATRFSAPIAVGDASYNVGRIVRIAELGKKSEGPCSPGQEPSERLSGRLLAREGSRGPETHSR